MPGNNPKILSDTEALARTVELIGFKETLKLIDGMFAICIVDRAQKSVAIARDFPGIKPAFYALREGALFVSSDITSVVKNCGSKLDREKVE